MKRGKYQSTAPHINSGVKFQVERKFVDPDFRGKIKLGPFP